MKNTYILLSIFILLLIGCSSSYTIKDFPSKDKFYQSFNSSVGSKEIDVTLTDKSQRTLYSGGTLKNDTLYALTSAFPVESIKNIKFKTKGGGASILIGILSGAAAEVIASYLYSRNHRNGGMDDAGLIGYYLVLFPLSAIVGGITGYYIGWNNTYQFNP